MIVATVASATLLLLLLLASPASAQLFTCNDTITVCLSGSETCCCTEPLIQPCECCSNAAPLELCNVGAGVCYVPSATPSASSAPSQSASVSTTSSASASASGVPSQSASDTPSPSALASGTSPPTPTNSATRSASTSGTPTPTPTQTPSVSSTPSESVSASSQPCTGVSLPSSSIAVDRCDASLIRLGTVGAQNQSALLDLTVTAQSPLVVVRGSVALLDGTRIALVVVPTGAPPLVVEGDVSLQAGTAVSVGVALVDTLLAQRATNANASTLFVPLVAVTSDQNSIDAAPTISVAATDDARLRDCESVSARGETRGRTFGVLLIVDSSQCTSGAGEQSSSDAPLNEWQLALLVCGSVALAALAVLVGTVMGYYACYRRGKCRWHEEHHHSDAIVNTRYAFTSAATEMGSALGTTASEAPRRPHPLALRTLVDLARFAGEWYLVASTVHAQPLRDVRFTYRLEAVAGGTPTLLIVEQGFALDSDKYAEWRALAVPFNQYNSLLAVTALNGPSPTTRVASADYHILAYDFSRNRWALVSTDNGRTVCFLSRATTLDTQAHSALATEAEDVHGYDMSQLVYTQHTPRVCIPDAFPALGPAPPIQQQSVAPPPYTHTDTTTGADTAGAPSTISGATARNRRNGNGGARRVRIAAAV